MKIKILVWIFFVAIFSSCSKDIEDLEAAKVTSDKFYVYYKRGDYKSIDTLIATRFYMVTPYNKFVEFLKSRKSTFGSLEEKELESYDVTVSTNSATQVVLKYKVKYELKNAQETFLLEKRNREFKIMEYKVD